MQLLQQQRASFALKRVNAVLNEKTPNIKQSEYRAYASQMPAMIHTNGFGQTMAFFRMKGGIQKNTKEASYMALYQLLEDWLCCKGDEKRDIPENQPYAGCDNLLTAIGEKDMQTYRQAQAEAEALLTWVKQFARAFLREEDDNIALTKDDNHE